jgi:hypothetical protein
MSDHESEISQTGEGAWDASNAFSSNGNDPADAAIATETLGEGEPDDRTKFLGDLARVMQSTVAAEQTRNVEGTEQRRKAHVDSIRTREAEEIEELRELAKEDVKGIDSWSEGEIKRIKLERERRIASRREQLQIRLEEHRSVVSREVDAVEVAVAAYRTEMEHYFGRLEGESDPVVIARLAGNQPTFPDLRQIGPEPAPVATEYGYVVSEYHAEAEAVADAPGGEPEAVIDTGTDAGAGPEAAAEPEPEGELIGVMDPDASNRPIETPWDSGVDTGDEGEGQGVGAAEAAGGVGAAEAVGAAEINQEAEAAQGSEEGSEQGSEEGSDQGTEEPAPVGAEARVVMPRSSGAGSWLRWPNSSVDHSDSSR